jgi:hypothetical protein
MGGNASWMELLAEIRGRIRQCREQADLHAERESFHRDQRARHMAELEELTRHAESIQAAADAVAALPAAERQPPAPPAPVVLGYGRGRRTPVMNAVKKVVEAKPAAEPFDARSVTAQVNARFAAQLLGTVDEEHVSTCLRRMARDRRIFVLGKGRPHHGTRYSRSQPPAAEQADEGAAGAGRGEAS